MKLTVLKETRAAYFQFYKRIKVNIFLVLKEINRALFIIQFLRRGHGRDIFSFKRDGQDIFSF